jgi:hypothetical protein
MVPANQKKIQRRRAHHRRIFLGRFARGAFFAGILILASLALGVFVCRRRCRPDNNRRSSMTGPAVVFGVPVPPVAHDTELSSDRSYGLPYSGSRPVASEPDLSSMMKI